MTGNDDNLKLITDIRRVLDDTPLDADSRAALQRARGHALQAGRRRAWRMPWLQVALGASLAAVLAVNLPERGKLFDDAETVKHVASAEPSPATSPAIASKPKQAPVRPASTKQEDAKPAVIASVPAVDADLLENLEMYEDAEFYQWLSEQDAEGAIDA
jgi:hypothetical protein